MNSSNERYQRQVILKGFGESAQDALLNAKVLIIGAGGLGCPVLQYLTAAGVGSIGIVDDDVVSLSNLHRQVLYGTDDIGKQKVSVAVGKLRLLNPDTKFVEYNVRLDKTNCLDIIDTYPVIVDCTDNFATRYMINDACLLKQKPLVYAAVSGFEGQVAVFNVSAEGNIQTGNYRDLFPEQPLAGEVLNCAEAGVLGVLPGIIGSLQACEVLKLITGIGDPLTNQLLMYNALDNQIRIFAYSHNKQSAITAPRNENDFYNMDYNEECANENLRLSITAEQFDEIRMQNDVLLVDVREPNELPRVTEFNHIQIPLRELNQKMGGLTKGTIVFFCHSGIRSQQAVSIATEYFGSPGRFYSLNGGLMKWKSLSTKQLT